MDQKICPSCYQELARGFDRVVDAQTGDSFRILVCPACGMGVTDPSPDNLDRYYRDEYHGNRHGMTTRLCDWRRQRIVTNHAGQSTTKRLLDVGCGDGTFLSLMAKNGWQVCGVEKYSQTLSNQTVNVVKTLDDAKHDGPFDCITLWHVMEHLTDLPATLKQLHAMLMPGGVVIIAVPDFGSFQAKRFGANWLHLDVPRHLHHFTQRSLEGLLAKHGFAPKKLLRSEFEYDLMGFAQSALNASGAEKNAFMKRMTGRSTQTRGWKLNFQLAVGLVLCGLGALPVFLSGCFGKGGTLIIVSKHLS